MKHSLKAGICAYLAGMALASDAAQVEIKVPIQCFPGADIVSEYKQGNTFKPLLVASDNETSVVAFVDPDDGEFHLWAIIHETKTPCLLDRSWLKVWNSELFNTRKGPTL